PRSELSSQGYTTMVDTVDTPLAATIRRSYFDPVRGALALAGMALIASLRCVRSRRAYSSEGTAACLWSRSTGEGVAWRDGCCVYCAQVIGQALVPRAPA